MPLTFVVVSDLNVQSTLVRLFPEEARKQQNGERVLPVLPGTVMGVLHGSLRWINMYFVVIISLSTSFCILDQ